MWAEGEAAMKRACYSGIEKLEKKTVKHRRMKAKSGGGGKSGGGRKAAVKSVRKAEAAGAGSIKISIINLHSLLGLSKFSVK
jgi:hypothetical protein